ncbi:2-dehydro-3-deoxygalactonokinase [Oceaniovalibus sp. ACAM 378]|nr:2-dehydro-3-deoxygalactonokinase [Oceaniovalibus sp. ACAM 378]
MRGEEVQILGALQIAGTTGSATICIPGTNAKWARADFWANSPILA